jgi:hypothetical protein
VRPDNESPAAREEGVEVNAADYLAGRGAPVDVIEVEGDPPVFSQVRYEGDAPTVLHTYHTGTGEVDGGAKPSGSRRRPARRNVKPHSSRWCVVDESSPPGMGGRVARVA